ncbi:general L-amino acid transport system permease protein [Cognatiyoonia koreensis]|uniref:General L-amino acid transport system permease protein n=1 Tax=Cognatiyoonia koreensis TaxID=364200 RepID=A0A1I0S1Y5_9RHOB|nr:amino acid ABC transporter permease [Cognatiyoonia koreensis]SEW47368.1 general L-amino acid transport system permease protein [Cognatiyoonia koreensis]
MSETHAQTVSYVRDTMLPEAAPPVTEVGVIKWMRESLFSSPLNGLLTLISLYVIYWVVIHIGPWLMNGIWDAGSLSECREIRNATIGEDASAACFAVLTDRWQQLIFGFYPSDAYWRPVLALIVFLVGIAPVLFDKLPRQMMIGTLIAPFLMYMLLWGGSIWGPIVVGLGFVLGYVAMRLLSQVSSLLGTLAAILVPILFFFTLAGPLIGLLNMLAPIGLEFVQSKDFGGFTLSVVIGIAAIILSLPLGILLALARQSDLPIIKYSAVVFIEVIRGVPLIVWLFTASLLLNYFLPPGTNFDLMLRVIIMVTLFSAAYIAEVIRGGLAALPKGQYEGGDSLGLNYWQSMQLIILPQALKISIPGIVNTFIGLFKDTTLVLFIGLLDPIGLSNAIRASTDWNGIYWELFLFIGVMFFIFCFSMGRYSLWLERKLQRENR